MKRKIRLQRGTPKNLKLEEFEVEVETGMVVLDAIHRIQATDAPDLAIRLATSLAVIGVRGPGFLSCLAYPK